MPNDTLTSPADTHASISCSSVSWRCVVIEGQRQQLFASATWVSIAINYRFVINFSAASLPPLISNETTPEHPFGRYFSAKAWYLSVLSPG